MAGRFGAYGKIPALGDFLRIGLGPGFCGGWDLWLQGALRTGREALGPRWQAAYLSAPLWRFALPGGVCGGGAVAGVLMPSVDRVGRQFPLTLAVEVPGAAAPALMAATDWAPVEDLALAMLEDGAGRDRLVQGLDALAVPAGLAGPPGGPTLWQAALAGRQTGFEAQGLPQGPAAVRLWDPAPAPAGEENP